MNIEPLPKALYDKLIANKFYKLTLSFSGGSDEGNVEVDFGELYGAHQQLSNEIEDWVWSVYSYSGAGDGTDYGDEIVYNLGTMTATHSDWCMQRTDGKESTESFKIVAKDGEDDEELVVLDPIVEVDMIKRKLNELKERTLSPVVLELIERLEAEIKAGEEILRI